MSNQAIAPSATQLTVSNGNPEWDDSMFYGSAKRAAARTSKGVTRERQLLNRNKLVSAVCADYRSHFASMYGKTDRLPSAVFEQIEKAVDKFLTEKLGEVNVLNCISYRRAFYHNAKQMEITERITNTGENKLTLKEQHLGVTLYIGQAERRLKELEAKPNPDYELEKAMKQRIMQLNLTKDYIEGEMAHQAKQLESK
jgi:hypothetical protein